MKYCSISEAAAAFKMSESMLRYYERQGLLPLIERDEAGRRIFSEDQMALLRTVNCLKNTNMQIKQIKQYIDWILEGDTTIERRLEMMKRHKQAVLDEIASMTESLQGIEDKITRYTTSMEEKQS
ncbi:MerR family transcriptional regulator [Cohnella lubricantis]|uniref:MerR family transcriptional regulator n=1 Tax=Cohnella lubricantis TaxID=2163172 RepID=A0A841TI81_9BACL|nr:MerR family transcriptional regulator [Cohnella lubricantis]MBB6678948.1 MerR family transcriptional regulator [Cohnella lubricantis]MBP2118834.1 DNA-binding transcriptional MerR regulator [Cohnella lubricantis]